MLNIYVFVCITYFGGVETEVPNPQLVTGGGNGHFFSPFSGMSAGRSARENGNDQPFVR